MLTSRLILTAALLVLPALSHAEDDPPFNTKSQVVIPFSGTVVSEVPAENVSVAGEVALKLMVSYRGGPVKVKAIAKLQNITATGQTSGDTYGMKGKSKLLTEWPTTISGIDVGVAMEGDPIPGLDHQIGKPPHNWGLVVYHVDTGPTGTVTGSSATIQALPAPNSAVTIPVLQITN